MTEAPRFNLKERASEVKSLLLQGEITYDQAREMLAPVVEEANTRAERIAKQFKRRPPKFSITALLR